MQNGKNEESVEFSFVLFKGATRPPEYKGMPYIPFMLSLFGGAGLGLIFKSFIPPVGAAFFIALLFYFGRKDPKFLFQMYLFIKHSGFKKLISNQLDESYEPNRPKCK
ncbi:VirB3 family type IV secretion system protein [Aeromonas veronii]|nr:VirB3 family type IV secretion system protein [Aeromonas veronii]